MHNNSILPKYKVIFYLNNLETGYLTKTPQQPEITPVMRVPFQLIIQPTQAQQIKCNASQIIRGKEKFKKSENYKFFTGLQETSFKNWFSGNDYENLKGEKKLSLILFHVFPGTGKLTLYYFGRFYIQNRQEREKFICMAIAHLQKLEMKLDPV